jgi:hypothetical protein
MNAAHMLPQCFSGWADMRAHCTLETAGIYMFRLDMRLHIGALPRVERTLEAEPETRLVLLHVISNQNIKP